MSVVTTYSKRKPVQRLCENNNSIFKTKGVFTPDSSGDGKSRSSNQENVHRNASDDNSTDTDSNREVFLSLSRSATSKRKLPVDSIIRTAQETNTSKHQKISKKTSKFAGPGLFQDRSSISPGTNSRTLRTRNSKADIKPYSYGERDTIKHTAGTKRCKGATPRHIPIGRLATRKPIKSPRLQPPRYVNMYRAPGALGSPAADVESQEEESSQETSGPESQPIPWCESVTTGDETNSCTEYTSTYIWTSATGSTASRYPSIELTRRQAAIEELFEHQVSPEYIVHDAKEKAFDDTDVSDISLDDGHCSQVLNSTLLDDQCAKNVQDVSILLSPIQAEDDAVVLSVSANEMKQRLETTPRTMKTIYSPRTPWKVKLSQPKLGKLQPKSSTCIFAEDDQKQIDDYITVELSEMPNIKDRQETKQVDISPEYKAIEQEFLTSTPVRGTSGGNGAPERAFAIDLSTIELKSEDSDELLFQTSNVVNSSEIHVSLPDDITALPAGWLGRDHSHNGSCDDIKTLTPPETHNGSPVDIITLPNLTDSPEIRNGSRVDITEPPRVVVDRTRSPEIHIGSNDDRKTLSRPIIDRTCSQQIHIGSSVDITTSSPASDVDRTCSPEIHEGSCDDIRTLSPASVDQTHSPERHDGSPVDIIAPPELTHSPEIRIGSPVNITEPPANIVDRTRSPEIHDGSDDDINASPSAGVDRSRSPDVGISDVEGQVHCVASYKDRVTVTLPVSPTSISDCDESKEALSTSSQVYPPEAYPVCVIVALPEDAVVSKESRILQWTEESNCSFKTIIENTPIDIIDAIDV